MSYSHLTEKERYVIYHLVLYRLSYREIARRLGRSHTTIIREVKRNRTYFNDYRDDYAHTQALKRRQKARHTRKFSNQLLVRYVHQHIQEDWSPETISNRLKIDFPRAQKMRVSAEMIYRWIFKDAANGGGQYHHLLRQHKKRRKQSRYGTGRGLIPERVSIHERPASIERRNRFGHWESDTVEGAKGSGGIATHVERKSRLLIAGKLSDKCAETYSQSTISSFELIPEKWRKTLTVDNGKEFAKFKQIESATGMKVYFADPYSPWQRGANENTNGLLRHYFPKGINWKSVTESRLASVVEKLNNRPRKCLGYRTPLEVFIKNTGGALGS